VYALAIAGRTGVRDYLLNLAADFDLTMGLAGRRSVAEIARDAITRAPGAADASAITAGSGL
jgi:isopentenyl diphosphate isomerase/L-lactate dehydrogenase-like FMN-dependent dehydrogenase